jgi:hypothetical protein
MRYRQGLFFRGPVFNNGKIDTEDQKSKYKSSGKKADSFTYAL